MVDQQKLVMFLEESNRIDNIFHVKGDEVDAAMAVMESPVLTHNNLLKYVQTIAPGAELSREPGGAFDAVITNINKGTSTPFRAHLLFAMLQPFTKANGPAARLAWYWQMQKLGGLQQSFLQQWYFDSLKAIG